MTYRKLITGFRAFHADYFSGRDTLFEQLSQGQSPKVMIIACSDSRIDPAILTQSEPGDIFSVRNVAALVPPDETQHTGHGTSAAVQYAVTALKVEHIIILGHALCGGIRALAESGEGLESDDSYIAQWIGIGVAARDKVRAQMPNASIEVQAQALEKAAILTSLNNLMTYPWVADAVEAGTLKLHGWYFDIPKGQLLNYNPEAMEFQDVLAADTMAANGMAAITATDCDCEAATVSLVGFINRFKAMRKRGRVEGGIKGRKSAALARAKEPLKNCVCKVKAKMAAAGTTIAAAAPEVETILPLL